MRFYPVALLAVLAVSPAACGGTGAAPTATPRHSANSAISREELDRAQAADLFSALQSLRPHWLNRQHAQTVNGGDGINVYVNGYKVGGLEELRHMSSADAATVAYLSPAQAQARFGVGNLNGAILVTSAGGTTR
jgi:hypothetical protein